MTTKRADTYTVKQLIERGYKLTVDINDDDGAGEKLTDVKKVIEEIDATGMGTVFVYDEHDNYCGWFSVLTNPRCPEENVCDWSESFDKRFDDIIDQLCRF